MKIIFMGTPDFAVPSLITLSENGYQPITVVTGSDKKSGRGQKIIPTPVKVASQQLNIPVIEVHDLKDPGFIDQIKAIEADIACVVAFKILPEELISIQKMGTINLHASLLPWYRGAAPIQRAIRCAFGAQRTQEYFGQGIVVRGRGRDTVNDGARAFEPGKPELRGRVGEEDRSIDG